MPSLPKRVRYGGGGRGGGGLSSGVTALNPLALAGALIAVLVVALLYKFDRHEPFKTIKFQPSTKWSVPKNIVRAVGMVIVIYTAIQLSAPSVAKSQQTVATWL